MGWIKLSRNIIVFAIEQETENEKENPESSGAMPATVKVKNTDYTLDDLNAGKITITEGSFVVGVEDGKKDEVLAALTAAPGGFTPTLEVSMPMFGGKLNGDQIKLLLEMDAVKYIEEDGEVKAAVNTS